MYITKRIIEKELQAISNMLGELPDCGQPPKGELIRRSLKGGTSYYYRAAVGQRGNRTSLCKKVSMETAVSLKNQRIVYEIRKKLIRNQKALAMLLKTYSDIDVEEIAGSLPKAFKDVPIGEILLERNQSDAMVKWATEPYERLERNFTAYHYNLAGEKMRSKSEVLISNLLIANKIPYRYEAAISLKDASFMKVKRFPDFTIMTPEGELIIWEHFGLLEQEAYAQDALSKINLYAMNGIIPGEGLIWSADGPGGSINSKTLQTLLEAFVLPHFE